VSAVRRLAVRNLNDERNLLINPSGEIVGRCKALRALTPHIHKQKPFTFAS
jgi:hypothetical protein